MTHAARTILKCPTTLRGGALGSCAWCDDATLQAIASGKPEGYSNEELAARLEVTPRTIQRRLALIRRIWAADHPS